MPNPITAREFANSKQSSVIAPAGCGKTHLISEAVQHCEGRQLVLTHTHAGVKAIRDRMVRLQVPAERYSISTLDAFALRYASAYPTLSGWTIREPQGKEWRELRPAATRVLKTRVIEAVLKASYTGVFVDEYQDCSLGQHELVVGLASVLPCRVLGDPLQSIFFEVNKTEALPWPEAEHTFPMLGQLSHPHRWAQKNEGLGRWLLEIRNELLNGGQIDFGGVPQIRFIKCDPQVQALTECLAKLGIGDETVVGLRKNRQQCHVLAGKLKGKYSVFEDAHCEDLMKWAEKIDSVTGPNRVRMIGELAGRWLTRLPKPSLASLMSAVCEGTPIRVRRPDLIHLANCLTVLRNDDGLRSIPPVLHALLMLEECPTMKSREVWLGLHQAALSCGPGGRSNLSESAWHHRDAIRRNGRRPWRRCLSTPLLVKGLEFDHCLILQAADFPDAESLYVSLTRASRSVTILGESSQVSPKRISK